jgi:hypothetical protein
LATTPYYDSMRLLRQTEFGDWEAPFTRLKEYLSKL